MSLPDQQQQQMTSVEPAKALATSLMQHMATLAQQVQGAQRQDSANHTHSGLSGHAGLSGSGLLLPGALGGFLQPQSSGPLQGVDMATLADIPGLSFINDQGPSSNGGSKRCNCKKAKCLKLYCVCFSAGVYCSDCSCSQCLNVEQHQRVVMAERQRVLQRSPHAFAPKVMGDVVHKKGCRCRKSKCLKKYCECYDASVYCAGNCKCEDCYNRPSDASGGPMRMNSATHEDMEEDSLPFGEQAAAVARAAELHHGLDFHPHPEGSDMAPILSELNKPACSLQPSGSLNGLWSMSYGGGGSRPGSLAPSPVSKQHSARSRGQHALPLLPTSLSGHLRSHVLGPMADQAGGLAPIRTTSMGASGPPPGQEASQPHQQQAPQQQPVEDPLGLSPLPFIADWDGAAGEAQQAGLHLLLRPEVLVNEPECALALAQHIGLDDTLQAAVLKAATVLRQVIQAAKKHPTFKGHQLPFDQDFALSLGAPEMAKSRMPGQGAPVPTTTTAAGNQARPVEEGAAAAGASHQGQDASEACQPASGPGAGVAATGAAGATEGWQQQPQQLVSSFATAPLEQGGALAQRAVLGRTSSHVAGCAPAASGSAAPSGSQNTGTPGSGTATGSGFRSVVRLMSGSYKLPGAGTSRFSDGAGTTARVLANQNSAPCDGPADKQRLPGTANPSNSGGLGRATSLPVPFGAGMTSEQMEAYHQQQLLANSSAAPRPPGVLPLAVQSTSQASGPLRPIRPTASRGASPTLAAVATAATSAAAIAAFGGGAGSGPAVSCGMSGGLGATVSGGNQHSALSGQAKGTKRTRSFCSDDIDEAGLYRAHQQVEVSSGSDQRFLRSALKAILGGGGSSPQSRTQSPLAAAARARRQIGGSAKKHMGAGFWNKVAGVSNDGVALDMANELEVVQALQELRGGG